MPNPPCYLISMAAIKRQLPQLQPNVHPDELEAALQLVHTNDLPPAITDCVTDLCADIVAAILSPAQETLLAELEPLLAWRVFYRYVEAWPLQSPPQGGDKAMANTMGYLQVGSRQLDRVSALGLAAARCVLYQEQFDRWLADNHATLACLQPPDACSPHTAFTGISGSAQ